MNMIMSTNMKMDTDIRERNTRMLTKWMVKLETNEDSYEI